MITTTRSESSQITTNAGALLGGRLAVAAMGWAGTVLIVRSLTESEFGRFTLVFSILGMASVVTELGLGRVAIKGVTEPGVDPGRFAGSYVVLRTMLGLLGYITVIAVVVLGGYDSQVVQATAIAGVVVVIATPSAGYDLAFQAHLRMGSVAVATVIGQAAQLALTVAVVVGGGAVLWFYVPAVAAELVIVLFKMRRAGRLIEFKYCVEPRHWWELIKEAVPLSIGGALVTLYNKVDAVMLSQLDTLGVVGLYGVAAKFADLARFTSTAVTVPILTVLVRSWPDDIDRFRAALLRGASLLLYCAGLALIGFGFFADDALGLLYGARFEVAAAATQILILGASMSFFTQLAIYVLVSAGRNRAYPMVGAVGLALNIGLNLYLIPRYSYEGAAWATVATNAVVLGLLWFHLLRLPGLRPVQMGVLWRVLPVAFVSVAATWMTLRFAPWAVAAGVAASTYTLAALKFGLFGPGGLTGDDVVQPAVADEGERQ
ncbi:MAG: flippase [Acidimicrobiales bacterium]